MSSTINYKSVFMQAPVGMCVAVDRVIVACNHALEAMFGFAPMQLQGESFAALYPTLDEFVRTGDRILPILGRDGHYADQRIMRRRGGDLFWCHVTGCVLEASNTSGLTVWTFEDTSDTRHATATLTPREREIAAFLVEGKTSKMIARAVSLSPRTVEMHRARMMKKLGAATALELVYKLVATASPPA